MTHPGITHLTPDSDRCPQPGQAPDPPAAVTLRGVRKNLGMNSNRQSLRGLLGDWNDSCPKPNQS